MLAGNSLSLSVVIANITPMNFSSRLGAATAALFLILTFSERSSASTPATWDDNGTSWNNTNDWSQGTIPNALVSGSEWAVTIQSNGSTETQPIVDGQDEILNISFSQPTGAAWDLTAASNGSNFSGSNLTGDYLIFYPQTSNGGIYNNATGTVTVATNIDFSSSGGSGMNFENTQTTGTLDVTGIVVGTTSASLGFGSAGTVILAGNNSFSTSGGLSISGTVTLQLGSANALGATTNTLRLGSSNGSGILDLDGNNASITALTGYNTHVGGEITDSGATSALTILGGSQTTAPTSVGGTGYEAFTFAGAAGLTFNFTSANNQYLGLQNSYASTNSGTVTIEGGNLYVGQASATTYNSLFGGPVSVTATSNTSGALYLQNANAMGYYSGSGITVSGYSSTFTGNLTSGSSSTAATYYLSSPLALRQFGIINPGGTGSEVTFSLGAPSAAATSSFTMSGGTLQLDLGFASATSSDQIAALSFNISGGTIALNEGTDFSTSQSYAIFTTVDPALDNSISGLTFTGVPNGYAASLNDDGDLTFTVSVVPEPGTWAMMLSGLAVLVFWQQRRSKQ